MFAVEDFNVSYYDGKMGIIVSLLFISYSYKLYLSCLWILIDHELNARLTFYFYIFLPVISNFG